MIPLTFSYSRVFIYAYCVVKVKKGLQNLDDRKNFENWPRLVIFQDKISTELY